MNSRAHIKTSKPIALLYAPEGSVLAALSDGLACQEFDTRIASNIEDFKHLSKQNAESIYACVFDYVAASDDLDLLIASAPSKLRSSQGPILVVKPASVSFKSSELTTVLVTKVMDFEDGQRALRLMISVEIEEYDRFTMLRDELKQRSSAIGLIVSGEFQIKTRREAQNLATMLSLTCPDPIPVAIGLTELLINSIEHGCLGIGHDEKGRLIESGILAETIAARSKEPEYSDCYVTLKFWREGDYVHFLIHDDGEGFDYTSYMGDSEGHSKKHGRGILMARGCFDTLEYRGKGNEVYATHCFC